MYSPDDMIKTSKQFNRKKFDDSYGYDQIGTKETIYAILHIAREWDVHPLNKDPKRLLQIGDVSRPGGINTPDHGEHNTGKAFDMRLLRKDKLLEGLTYSQKTFYSLSLTKAFILLAGILIYSIIIGRI